MFHSKLEMPKVVYLNSFKVNHEVFDGRITSALHTTSINTPKLPYLLSCIYCMLFIRFKRDIIVLATFSNWMIPFLPKSSRYFFIIHNNLERRFKSLLKYRQEQLLLTHYGQMSHLKNSIFIGHPVLRMATMESTKIWGRAIVITEDKECVKKVEDEISRDLVIKGSIGERFIDDLEDQLQMAEFLIIDRQYVLRPSSLVSLGISLKCKILVTCPITKNNLNETFSTDKIECIDNWKNAQFFDESDVNKIDSIFFNRLKNIFEKNNK